MSEITSRIDEWGEKEYVKRITLKLDCMSYDKTNLENIENDILEVITDKAFDGICNFEKVKE